MLCPFCLNDVTFRLEQAAGLPTPVYICPKCEEQVPALYVRDYDRYPPVVASAIGSRLHGKTIYFGVLFYTILLDKFSPAHYWPNFFKLALNEESLDTIY